MAYIKEWFKVIKDGKFVGAVTEQSFARYSERSGRVHICKAIEGEYVVVNDRYFHDDWMLPVNPKSYMDYEEATVVSIGEKEYNILVAGEEPPVKNEIVKIPAEEISKKVSETDEVTVEFIREKKLKELSATCEKAIEDGFSLVLSDGASHHFSMSIPDQLNLANLQRALDLCEDPIYHADGELMQFYSQEDAQDILIGANKWRAYNQALYNSLKNWINNLTDIETINKITYDSSIPEEYCSVVLLSLSENF